MAGLLGGGGGGAPTTYPAIAEQQSLLKMFSEYELTPVYLDSPRYELRSLIKSSAIASSSAAPLMGVERDDVKKPLQIFGYEAGKLPRIVTDEAGARLKMLTDGDAETAVLQMRPILKQGDESGHRGYTGYTLSLTRSGTVPAHLAAKQAAMTWGDVNEYWDTPCLIEWVCAIKPQNSVIGALWTNEYWLKIGQDVRNCEVSMEYMVGLNTGGVPNGYMSFKSWNTYTGDTENKGYDAEHGGRFRPRKTGAERIVDGSTDIINPYDGYYHKHQLYIGRAHGMNVVLYAIDGHVQRYLVGERYVNALRTMFPIKGRAHIGVGPSGWNEDASKPLGTDWVLSIYDARIYLLENAEYDLTPVP